MVNKSQVMAIKYPADENSGEVLDKVTETAVYLNQYDFDEMRFEA